MKMNKKKTLEQLTRGEWEAICERCGRCCYEKYEYRDKIFYSKAACRYLDLKNNSCKVYADRTRHQPECAQLTPELVRAGILPEDCPYVRRIKEESDSEAEL